MAFSFRTMFGAAPRPTENKPPVMGPQRPMKVNPPALSSIFGRINIKNPLPFSTGGVNMPPKSQPAPQAQQAVSSMQKPANTGGGGSWGPTPSATSTPSRSQVAASAVPPAPAPSRREPSTPSTPWVAPASGQGTGTQAEIERQNAQAAAALAAMRGLSTSGTTQNNAPTTPPSDTTSSGGSSYRGYQVSPEVKAARDAYLASLRPSEEENRLADQLAQFRGDTKQGVVSLEGQGRGIPLGLIRGMQGKLTEQANYQEQTLMERLAAQQAQRQLAATAAEKELGFLTEDQKAMLDQEKPFEANAPLVRFNAATGKYEEVYTPPADASEGFTLSPGQQRFDATGNLLASGGPEQLSALDSARMRQIEADIAATTDPVERALKLEKYQAEIDKLNREASASTAASKLPATVQEKLYQSKTLMDLMGQLEQFGGNLPGIGLTGNVPAPLLSEEGRQVRNILNILRSEISKIRGGSTFTDQEKALIESFTPTTDNWDVTALSKLAGLKNYLATLTGNINAQYQLEGQQETIPSENDPLGLGFNQGSRTPSTKGANEALKQSLVQQESGGNYKAVGAMTPYGKALGKYQIIPSFHFAKIGLKNTPEDQQRFLNTPALQDQLFGAIIDELAGKYNNDPRKIAAAYYGGPGGAAIVGTPAADRPQYAGGRRFPSINEYVNSVISRIS